jgi:hypothetical protein
MLTQEHLKEVLHYDSETGIFTWIKSTRRGWVGKIAGYRDPQGYIGINLDCKMYRAHQLAWLYVKGTWPEFEIDHKDTIKHHNWFSNLRGVSVAGNQQNQVKAKSHNKVGLLGVTKQPSGKFASAIVVDEKSKFLGTFITPQEAHTAYVTAKRVLHPNCTI